MMKLLGKIDGTLIAVIGAVGWVLHANDKEGAAIALAVCAGVAGGVGLVTAAVVWIVGGHQSRELTASVGHVAPWLARAAGLIGLGWAGAFAASKAGLKGEGLAIAASVAVFGVAGDVIKPIKEWMDGLRPTRFGKAAIQHVYGDRFDVDPNAPQTKAANGRAAVHDEDARIHDVAGTQTKAISGWKLGARRDRLGVIADSL